MTRSGWSEMISDTWRYEVIKNPEEFLSQHWSSRLIDSPLLLAIEIENHLDNAEKYGAEKERDRIVKVLSKHFNKEEIIRLINEKR